jgi:DNA topoisomerase-1
VKDKDFRTLDSEEELLTITVERASEIFRLPKVFKRGAARNMATAGPLREFGNDPVSERPVVARDGRFGVYVTDGETNASIGKGDRIETMEPERAFELLAIRRDQVAAKGGAPAKKPKSAASKSAAKKTAGKKSAAKKSAAQREHA